MVGVMCDARTVHLPPQVQYECRGFLEKNRDRLPNEILVLLRGSDCALVRQIFHGTISPAGEIDLPISLFSFSAQLVKVYNFSKTVKK